MWDTQGKLHGGDVLFDLPVVLGGGRMGVGLGQGSEETAQQVEALSAHRLLR